MMRFKRADADVRCNLDMRKGFDLIVQELDQKLHIGKIPKQVSSMLCLLKLWLLKMITIQSNITSLTDTVDLRDL